MLLPPTERLLMARVKQPFGMVRMAMFPESRVAELGPILIWAMVEIEPTVIAKVSAATTTTNLRVCSLGQRRATFL